jgi:hypothetical protein
VTVRPIWGETRPAQRLRDQDEHVAQRGPRGVVRVVRLVGECCVRLFWWAVRAMPMMHRPYQLLPNPKPIAGAYHADEAHADCDHDEPLQLLRREAGFEE